MEEFRLKRICENQFSILRILDNIGLKKASTIDIINEYLEIKAQWAKKRGEKEIVNNRGLCRRIIGND